MKAVEVRVRKLAGLGDEVIGVDLMNKSFGPTGPLTDQSVGKGEQEGTRMLFAGPYAVLRNPAGHRQVDYDDQSEAAEAVQVASLLMRILDRVEDRLGTAGPQGPSGLSRPARIFRTEGRARWTRPLPFGFRLRPERVPCARTA